MLSLNERNTGCAELEIAVVLIVDATRDFVRTCIVQWHRHRWTDQ